MLTTLNVNGLSTAITRQKLSERLESKRQLNAICKVKHSKYKDTDRFLKKHANRNYRKDGEAILISEKNTSQNKEYYQR